MDNSSYLLIEYNIDYISSTLSHITNNKKKDTLHNARMNMPSASGRPGIIARITKNSMLITIIVI